MKKSTTRDLAHLEWAIESRSENQRCAMKLLKLLTAHSDKIKRLKFDLFAQALVGITFSLWRAAFLADKSGLREASFRSAMNFLGTVIADNAINFAQDKQEREWTFNYYTNNVRYTMIQLAKDYPEFVQEWKSKDRPPNAYSDAFRTAIRF